MTSSFFNALDIFFDQISAALYALSPLAVYDAKTLKEFFEENML